MDKRQSTFIRCMPLRMYAAWNQVRPRLNGPATSPLHKAMAGGIKVALICPLFGLFTYAISRLSTLIIRLVRQKNAAHETV